MAEGDQVRGWKEIAAFLGTSVRTARRWEGARELPVRRQPGGGREAVFAFRDELERWQRGNPMPGDGWGGPRRLLTLRRTLLLAGVTVGAISILVWPGHVRSHQVPDPQSERRGGGSGPAPAPIALQYVRLDLSRADGWQATIDIPDGGVGQTGGAPGYPLLVFRPRLAAAGLMLEVARADGEPVKDQGKGALPMVLLLEPNVPIQVRQPYPFWVRWVTSGRPPR